MENLKNVENETIHAAFMFTYKGYQIITSNIMLKKCGAFKIEVKDHGEVLKKDFASVEEAILYIDYLEGSV